MNFIAIPRNASRSVCYALGIKHRHDSVWIKGTPAWAIIREPADRMLSWYNHHRQNNVPGYEQPFSIWVKSKKHHWVNELKEFRVTNPLHQHEFVGDVCSLIPYDNLAEGLRLLGLNLTLKRIGRTQHLPITPQLRNWINTEYSKDYNLYVLAKQRGILHPESL